MGVQNVTMSIKQWLRQFHSLPPIVILSLTIVFVIIELVISHVTKSLTLLVDSYQTLCNVFALTTHLMIIKHEKNSNGVERAAKGESKNTSLKCAELEITKSNIGESTPIAYEEIKLNNTFGWARIDVLTLVICYTFLASLIFSLPVQIMWPLMHVDQIAETPAIVGSVGLAGLILNALSYFLIGGYTFHQRRFLNVYCSPVVTEDFIKQSRKKHSCKEILRDTIGCIIVIICSIIIYFTEVNIAKFVDSVLAILSIIIILVLSFPYMKESCLILLQTIPKNINADLVKKTLLANFPEIINIHDFHVWQLTADKVISTAHVIFQDLKAYESIKDDINQFFKGQGITQVTVQPEFFSKSENSKTITRDDDSCLMICQGQSCKINHCCPDPQDMGTILDNSTVVTIDSA